jgi:hypothetical protein
MSRRGPAGPLRLTCARDGATLLEMAKRCAGILSRDVPASPVLCSFWPEFGSAAGERLGQLIGQVPQAFVSDGMCVVLKTQRPVVVVRRAAPRQRIALKASACYAHGLVQGVPDIGGRLQPQLLEAHMVSVEHEPDGPQGQQGDGRQARVPLHCVGQPSI